MLNDILIVSLIKADENEQSFADLTNHLPLDRDTRLQYPLGDNSHLNYKIFEFLMNLEGNIQLDFNPDTRSFSPESYKASLDNKKLQPSESSTQNMMYDENEPKESQQAPKSTGCCGVCSFDYYEPYFNISQQEVVKRITRSLTPWKKDFFDCAQNPDLYGPFWILTTIIFLLSLMGNLTTYLGNLHEEKFEFRLELVRIATVVVYAFGIGFPIALGLLLKFFKAKLSPFKVLCIYGYSLSCFVPILILCVIPANFLQWILMIYGILNSTMFLIVNINHQIRNLAPQKQYIIYALLATCQISLFLTFKIVFFKTVYEGASQADTSEADND